MKKNKIAFKITTIIFWIIMIIILSQLYKVYKSNYYNDFIKAEYNLNSSKFTRDNEEKYSKYYSYKIESSKFNDAIFYKTIKVNPQTPYKLTCMVKTKDIENKKLDSNAGASINIVGYNETTEGITGSKDWQKVEFLFNSKNREEIKIGFRLGGNDDESKGTAWFSDFSLEEGTQNTSNTWEFACFIFKNVDIEIEGKQEKISMSLNDIDIMNRNMERFQKTCKELSDNNMIVSYDIYEIETPITSATYSETFGYYIDPKNVKDILKEYLNKKNYDHIFVCAKLGDKSKQIEIPVYDWIGLRRYGFKSNWIFKY